MEQIVSISVECQEPRGDVLTFEFASGERGGGAFGGVQSFLGSVRGLPHMLVAGNDTINVHHLRQAYFTSSQGTAQPASLGLRLNGVPSANGWTTYEGGDAERLWSVLQTHLGERPK